MATILISQKDAFLPIIKQLHQAGHTILSTHPQLAQALKLVVSLMEGYTMIIGPTTQVYSLVKAFILFIAIKLIFVSDPHYLVLRYLNLTPGNRHQQSRRVALAFSWTGLSDITQALGYLIEPGPNLGHFLFVHLSKVKADSLTH
jgi:hypothetical protein